MLEKAVFNQVAFGIRYLPHFQLEDHFGVILDKVLSKEKFGPTRFSKIAQSHASRQLIGTSNQELLSISREDLILDSKLPLAGVSAVVNMAKDFSELVWKNVWENGSNPSANRFGLLVSFDLPSDWSPIETFLGIHDQATSDFTLRYSHRLASSKALSNKRINDYRIAIYQIHSVKGKKLGVIDYQLFFDPCLESSKAFEEQPFSGFAEEATTFIKSTGWEFIKSRVDRLAKVA